MRKNRAEYFTQIEGAPPPVTVEIQRIVRFSEVDALRIVWHGRYPAYFEEGSEALGRLCGLTYRDFYDAGLGAPIVKMHIDYFQPLLLGEVFTIRASLIWDDAARLNTEFYLLKGDGTVATSAYTVQLFTSIHSGEPCIVSPALLQRCRKRWAAGEFCR